jgi:hypothetical protein
MGNLRRRSEQKRLRLPSSYYRQYKKNEKQTNDYFQTQRMNKTVRRSVNQRPREFIEMKSYNRMIMDDLGENITYNEVKVVGPTNESQVVKTELRDTSINKRKSIRLSETANSKGSRNRSPMNVTNFDQVPYFSQNDLNEIKPMSVAIENTDYRSKDKDADLLVGDTPQSDQQVYSTSVKIKTMNFENEDSVNVDIHNQLKNVELLESKLKKMVKGHPRSAV